MSSNSMTHRHKHSSTLHATVIDVTMGRGADIVTAGAEIVNENSGGAVSCRQLLQGAPLLLPPWLDMLRTEAQ